MVDLDGLHPTVMRPRVIALLADVDARRLGLWVVSAYRSVAHQQQLWEEALRKYIDPEIADNWVARPGQSNHGPRVDGYGTAVDLGVRGVQSLRGQWPADVERQVNEIARRYGLASPLAWEDWHFEPIPGWIAPAATPLAAVFEEDDMIPGDAVVDTLACTVVGCAGWWEVRADGAVETLPAGSDHAARHYFGSIHEPWMAEHRLPNVRFLAIGPRRGGIGYTTWGHDGNQRRFYEFGPGIGPS